MKTLKSTGYELASQLYIYLKIFPIYSCTWRCTILESHFQPAYAHMRVNRMLECGVVTKTLYNQVGY